MTESYGIISCIPIVLMMALIFKTKRLFESVLVSCAVALMISDGTGFVKALIDHIYATLANETYAWILLMLLLFGGLIRLFEESGGTFGFRNLAIKYIKNEKASLIVTWILGIVIFIDDYLNNLAIGSAMRGITDKYKIPREMTALTINATGGPVCVLLPFSTWAVFIFGVMQESGVQMAADATVLTEYTKVIPYIFFAIVMVIMVPLLALGVIPKFGPLKKAYQRAQEDGGSVFPVNLVSEEKRIEETEETEEESNKQQLRDFLIPMLLVIGVTVYTSDLIFGVMSGIFSAFLLYIPTGKMKVTSFFDSIFEGMKDMLYIGVFILFAFIFVESVNHLGFSDYIIEAISPYLVGGIIPVLTFIVIAAMCFFGIDFWGIMILTFPIIIPLSIQFDVNVYLSLGAIISGSVFGGMACFFSEQMIMSSTSCEIRPNDQAICLLPYAMVASVISAAMFLVGGFVA
ncbi:MAG: Na+/H+ antiporter NhaC family protein [Desulforhopalus sp.]